VPEFSSSIHIEAPPEVVFAHLVTAERMVLWMGQSAELEAKPGGVFSVDVNGFLFRGEYLEVEPPHRVVWSWGIEGAEDLPPGSSRVEFTLDPTATGTMLNLVHSGLPDSRATTHGAGWGNYLARLQAVAGGRDPGPDTWMAASNAALRQGGTSGS
jgi:uncharacterized protein YndB with AHSA1/START domain